VGALHHDDLPARTEVRYSRKQVLLVLVVTLAISGLGLWLWFQPGDPAAALFALVVPLPIALLMATRLVRSSVPRLVLSDAGVQLRNGPLIPWSELDADCAHSSGSHFILDHPGGRQLLSLQQLDHDGEQIEALVAGYRRRSLEARGPTRRDS
jgi:hypothetical protein